MSERTGIDWLEEPEINGLIDNSEAMKLALDANHAALMAQEIVDIAEAAAQIALSRAESAITEGDDWWGDPFGEWHPNQQPESILPCGIYIRLRFEHDTGYSYNSLDIVIEEENLTTSDIDEPWIGPFPSWIFRSRQSSAITEEDVERITPDEWGDLLSDHAMPWQNEDGDCGQRIDEGDLPNFLRDVITLLRSRQSGEQRKWVLVDGQEISPGTVLLVEEWSAGGWNVRVVTWGPLTTWSKYDRRYSVLFDKMPNPPPFTED